MTTTSATSGTKTIEVPLNRVEGDLEVKVEIENGVVTDAWSAGTLYRGFENMMRGRGALDGLVITPRICGICSTAQLMAAALALDAVADAPLPRNGLLARNLALMTEFVQSDLRHGLLMFLTDFVNPAYSDQPLYDEAVRRFAPLAGSSVIDAINETRSLIEIIALIGGQWPHSTYMVPGGTTTNLKQNEIFCSQHLLDKFQRYYEQRVLGCRIERWLEVKSAADLDAWLDERSEHRDSDLGFFIRFSRAIGLDRIGAAHGHYLSFGALDIPPDSDVHGRRPDGGQLIPSGFAERSRVAPLDQDKITEHVAHSWYKDYDGGLHPARGRTEPHASGFEPRKYSWSKAPRYDGLPAETGPLAEMIVAGNTLFQELAADGANAFVRELARLVRPVELLPAMRRWLREIDATEPFYRTAPRVTDGEGFGLTEAARGALGHWISIADGRIEHYQIVTPTAWNCSPRDSDDIRGPWEEALVGTPVADAANPVELGHVVRSYDACLVCCVHAVRGGRSLVRMSV